MIDFFEGPQGRALKKIAERLWAAGHQVFLAGGCVRDALLGRSYKDLDVVTDASVDQVQKLFEKTVPVGVQFGIVRVLIDGFEFEVARFRSDGAYLDGRHPNFVRFAGPEEDAARRDFTVNALFYDLKNQKILDFVGGQADIQKQVLRAVGDPLIRFSEDYLRILRLLRFSCQLGFTVEPKTARAAQEKLTCVAQVSGERLRVEITKAIDADSEKAFRGFMQWNLCSVLFPHWPLQELSDQMPQLLSLVGHHEVGWLLAPWLLNFQPTLCREALERVSDTEWKFNKNYLEKVSDLTVRFSLSRKDSQMVRDVGAVLAWGPLWDQLRLGVRAYLSQSKEFGLVLEAADQLSAWPKDLLAEAQRWSREVPLQPLLTGRDVEGVAPERRGLILKECLYLHYEGVLVDRAGALRWLAENAKK
ncbi:MAG: hypothetical protein RJB66_1564 [Pseudomonadota bacterium]